MDYWFGGVQKGENVVLEHCHLCESNVEQNKCKLLLLPKELLSLANFITITQIVGM